MNLYTYDSDDHAVLISWFRFTVYDLWGQWKSLPKRSLDRRRGTRNQISELVASSNNKSPEAPWRKFYKIGSKIV